MQSKVAHTNATINPSRAGGFDLVDRSERRYGAFDRFISHPTHDLVVFSLQPSSFCPLSRVSGGPFSNSPLGSIHPFRHVLILLPKRVDVLRIAIDPIFNLHVQVRHAVLRRVARASFLVLPRHIHPGLARRPLTDLLHSLATPVYIVAFMIPSTNPRRRREEEAFQRAIQQSKLDHSRFDHSQQFASSGTSPPSSLSVADPRHPSYPRSHRPSHTTSTVTTTPYAMSVTASGPIPAASASTLTSQFLHYTPSQLGVSSDSRANFSSDPPPATGETFLTTTQQSIDKTFSPWSGPTGHPRPTLGELDSPGAEERSRSSSSGQSAREGGGAGSLIGSTFGGGTGSRRRLQEELLAPDSQSTLR